MDDLYRNPFADDDGGVSAPSINKVGGTNPSSLDRPTTTTTTAAGIASQFNNLSVGATSPYSGNDLSAFGATDGATLGGSGGGFGSDPTYDLPSTSSTLGYGDDNTAYSARGASTNELGSGMRGGDAGNFNGGIGAGLSSSSEMDFGRFSSLSVNDGFGANTAALASTDGDGFGSGMPSISGNDGFGAGNDVFGSNLVSTSTVPSATASGSPWGGPSYQDDLDLYAGPSSSTISRQTPTHLLSPSKRPGGDFGPASSYLPPGAAPTDRERARAIRDNILASTDILGDDSTSLLSSTGGLKAAFKKSTSTVTNNTTGAASSSSSSHPTSTDGASANANGSTADVQRSSSLKTTVTTSGAVSRGPNRRKRGIEAGMSTKKKVDEVGVTPTSSPKVKNAREQNGPESVVKSGMGQKEQDGAKGESTKVSDTDGTVQAGSSKEAGTNTSMSKSPKIPEGEKQSNDTGDLSARKDDAAKQEGEKPRDSAEASNKPEPSRKSGESQEESNEDVSPQAPSSPAQQTTETASAANPSGNQSPPPSQSIPANSSASAQHHQAIGSPGRMDLKTLPPLPSSASATPRTASPYPVNETIVPLFQQSTQPQPQPSLPQPQMYWSPAVPNATEYWQPTNAPLATPPIQPPTPELYQTNHAPAHEPEPEPQPVTPPMFQIFVTDPTKVGDPIRGHVVYTVTTRTSSPKFQRAQFSVFRRFSDFLWLFDRLIDNNPGVIVPPVPDKHFLGRFEESFLETRRAALERCLEKIANHSILSQDRDLQTFLESDAFASEAKARRTETPTSATNTGLLANTISTLSGPKFSESDEWFESKKTYIDNLESQLKALVKAIEGTSKQRIELINSTSDLLQAITDLSECDLATDLTAALQRFAELTRREKDLYEEQARSEISGLLSLCDEYVRLIGSIRLAFASRIKSYMTWQQLEFDSRKAKANHEKLRKQGKVAHDRIQFALSELAEGDRRVVDAHSDFDACTRLCKVEFDRFEKERVQEYKKMLQDYLDEMVEGQKDLITSWEAYHSLLAKMVGRG